MSFTRPVVEALPVPSLLIGADRIESTGSDHRHLYPGTGGMTAEMPLAGSSEIDLAVRTAREAFRAWRHVSVDQRRSALLRLAGLVRANSEELTSLAIVENGTACSIASQYPASLADKIEYNAGWADKIGGEVVPSWPLRALDYTLEEPYGVVGIIVTWNSPLGTAGMTLAPALAAGNAVIFKAPELAPWSSLRLGELALEAGFPPGIVNIVCAGPEGSEALVRHRGVDFIHFTGGGRTAKHVLRAAAESLKPVGLELGGKSPRIVFGDGDVAAALTETVGQLGKLAGQGCINGMRVLAHDDIYDDVVQGLAEQVSRLQMGDPFDASTEVGPVISREAVHRIERMVAQAHTDGARLVVGGDKPSGDLAEGFFVQPTVFADVDPQTELSREEVFGPVVSVTRFRTTTEAIELANDTDYGLAAYIWTNDMGRAHFMAGELEAGNLWVNGYAGLPASMPFGGYKQSGMGRLGGRDAIREFTRTKNVWTPLRQPHEA